MTLAALPRHRRAFVPRAQRSGWLLTARRLAWHCVERWPAALVVLGVLGMLGFVSSLIALGQRRLETPAFLFGTGLSLAVYSASLLVGHFADPSELERRGPASRATGPHDERGVR